MEIHSGESNPTGPLGPIPVTKAQIWPDRLWTKLNAWVRPFKYLCSSGIYRIPPLPMNLVGSQSDM